MLTLPHFIRRRRMLSLSLRPELSQPCVRTSLRRLFAPDADARRDTQTNFALP
jgi:hypothetical protein